VENEASQRATLIATLRRELLARPEIVFAYLHGSFLSGGPYRDIDVAIWLDPARVEAGHRGRYALDLSVALHLALRRPVDVRALNDASLGFRFHALKGEPLVVRDAECLDEMRARTWDEYFDFLPFARRYLREALGE
jgi:predicted nucleotidyltransferase